MRSASGQFEIYFIEIQKNLNNFYIYHMKYTTIIIAALLGIALWLTSGCTKTNQTVFSWDYQGVHYVADSSSAVTSTSAIAAYSQLTALGISAGTSLAVGTYSFHPVNNSGQPYMFFEFASTLYSQSGTLNITYNNGKQLSGNFTVTYNDGTTMSGVFTDIPIR